MIRIFKKFLVFLKKKYLMIIYFLEVFPLNGENDGDLKMMYIKHEEIINAAIKVDEI